MAYEKPATRDRAPAAPTVSARHSLRASLGWTALAVTFAVLVAAAVTLPATAAPGGKSGKPGAPGKPDEAEAPELSTGDRLGERRYVATGDRAYIAGTENGRFPAMGFHTRGEMGGVWSPPIKLLDGMWFGIDDEWIGPAEEFTSGYGHTKMDLPSRDGLQVERTDFAPDGKRAVLVGLEFEAGDEAQEFSLKMDAHSELMSAYPWGETNPSQEEFNLEDEVEYRDGRLVFTEQGTPPVENAEEHDWAAAVGSKLEPASHETGEDFRGPQDPAEICPASPDDAPDRCDDTEYGKGKGGQISYDIEVPANSTKKVWFSVGGSESGAEDAVREQQSVLRNPDAALEEKVKERQELQERTDLDIPADPQLEQSIDWSKQNLADSVQEARDLKIRETNAGENYPGPEGELDKMRFLGAGFPDYQWLFGTDGEYTVFASVAAGQFGPIEEHLRALKEVSLIDNGDSGKVTHEVVTDGSIFFGSNADEGNIDETAKFPSAVALYWRWTGDDAFRDEMYEYTKSNMEYIFREVDEDGDLWPEGLGNVERPGMGEEKLDNTVYTIRGLYDLADMAESKGDEETVRWATERAEAMESRFEDAWWMEEVPQHADSLENPDNEKIQQRHWIGATPMEVELAKNSGPDYGLTTENNASDALDLRETDCYGDDFGLFHTGDPGCDPAESEADSEKQAFTLNTAIMAVAEGNYGRLGEDEQQRFTRANARLQLPEPDNPSGEPDEQPGAMPEIAPSPLNGRTIDRPLNERPMVLQAWGAYGTLWPVVHQQLGVAPDLGRNELSVVPRVPDGQPGLSAENIRLGRGSLAVSAEREGSTYTTEIRSRIPGGVRPTIGHTIPEAEKVDSVTLNGREVRYEIRETNRGKEVIAQGRPGAAKQTLVVETDS